MSANKDAREYLRLRKRIELLTEQRARVIERMAFGTHEMPDGTKVHVTRSTSTHYSIRQLRRYVSEYTLRQAASVTTRKQVRVTTPKEQS